MTLNELDIKIDEYITTKVMPNVENTGIKFTIGMARFLGKTSIKSHMTPKQLKEFGVIDDNEIVDVSLLQKMIYAGFDASPELDMFKLVFTKADAEDFFNFLGVK